MTKALGYERYGAHGGDWGSTVTEQIARSHGRAVVGIHLTDVPFWHQFQKPSDLSAAERAWFADTETWVQQEGAYALIQGTRPSSLAPALNDSPAGLAAWIVEKFRSWSDCGGDVERRFTKDELLTNVTIYWVTETINRRTALLRLASARSAGSAAAIKRGRTRRAGGVRACSQADSISAAGVRRALLQRRALDRDAARRPLRRPRGAGAARATTCASSSGRCGPPRRTHHERKVTTWHPSARKS